MHRLIVPNVLADCGLLSTVGRTLRIAGEVDDDDGREKEDGKEGEVSVELEPIDCCCKSGVELDGAIFSSGAFLRALEQKSILSAK